MKILFVGGGTLGPVTPLLAVAEEIARMEPKAECAFVGTPEGPERRLVEEAGFRFLALSAPKLRRYFSLKTLLLPFSLARATLKAGRLLAAERPDAVVGAGGYVQVPLVLAARRRGIKVLLHQQDVVPTLSNTLVASMATAVTVTFGASLADFPEGKAEAVGNPVRRGIEEGDRARGLASLGLTGGRPVVLAFGGGTGSAFLNRLVAEGAPLWTENADLVHLTGIEKSAEPPKLQHPGRYHRREFVGKGIADLMAAADLVIGRAGMGTLTELAALARPVLLVPIAGSHQEKNAERVAAAGGARVFRESELTPEALAAEGRKLLGDPDGSRRMGLVLQAAFRPGAREALARKVLGLVS